MKYLLGLTLTLLGGFSVADASVYSDALVGVEVIDRDNGAGYLPLLDAGGSTYIVAEPGHRYSVQLRNRSAARVLVVLSVDGVNALTGASADPQQSGYVLPAYGMAEIKGWRKSMDQVAEFVFSAPERSYAARTGRPQNVGVIGVAVFREAPVNYPFEQAPAATEERQSWRERGIDRAAPSAQAAAPAGVASANQAKRALADKDQYREDQHSADQHSELGTGHGQRTWSPVATTEFARASDTPDAIIELQYDTYRHLVERGVIPRQRHYHRQPRAFAGGFVADPPYR
ncbi:MAG: hypothetical protein COS34_02030 [Lysobacterales bacterium CG02_land_8_20_14_3_00_62_12]|nr:MAG: hypothetical protein COS34_02030 [Xanthomonadales bacterium CG02_land_8_20_14_3_00_62_12]